MKNKIAEPSVKDLSLSNHLTIIAEAGIKLRKLISGSQQEFKWIHLAPLSPPPIQYRVENQPFESCGTMQNI